MIVLNTILFGSVLSLGTAFALGSVYFTIFSMYVLSGVILHKVCHV